MSIKQNLNHHLKLLNTTIIPKFYNCLYSPEENILIYPIFKFSNFQLNKRCKKYN